MKNKDYKKCKNSDSDCCILFAACRDCYYYAKNELICPNCGREIPNLRFKRKHGCPYCVPEKRTEYCDGIY